METAIIEMVLKWRVLFVAAYSKRGMKGCSNLSSKGRPLDTTSRTLPARPTNGTTKKPMGTRISSCSSDRLTENSARLACHSRRMFHRRQRSSVRLRNCTFFQLLHITRFRRFLRFLRFRRVNSAPIHRNSLHRLVGSTANHSTMFPNLVRSRMVNHRHLFKRKTGPRRSHWTWMKVKTMTQEKVKRHPPCPTGRALSQIKPKRSKRKNSPI